MEPSYSDVIGLNYSGSKALLQSPAHYQAWLTSERDDTPALRMGRLVHLAFLQPKEFGNTVVVMPEDAPDKPTKAMLEAYVSGSTKQKPESVARIKWWEVFHANLPAGVEIIDQEEFDLISDIAEAAEGTLGKAGPDVSTWEVETPLYKDMGGCFIKGRPDLVTVIGGKRVVVDLKTTEDASPGSFSRDTANFKYHMQAAFYLELTGAESFILLAVEKKKPHGSMLYELNAESIAAGKALMDEAIATYKMCLTMNRWPSYPPGLHSLSIPKYALSQTQ